MELLITVTILPLVIGGISVALLSIFNLQSGVTNRIAGSGDAQVVSADFISDVQSATAVTTQTTPQCGTASGGTQLLGLEWSNSQNVVSYVAKTTGSTTTLVRQACALGNTTTPTSSLIISSSISYVAGSASSPTALATCASTAANCVVTSPYAWQPASGIAALSVQVTEAKGNYAYTLIATPRAWSSGGNGTQPYAPLTLLGTSCSALSISNTSSLYINLESGYTGVTSSSSFKIAQGSTTWSTPYTANYIVGQQVMVSYTTTPSDYMEGYITALVPNSSITVNVTTLGGSGGPYAAWTFSIIGNGILAVQSTCSNTVVVNGNLYASGVLTANPTLNSVSGDPSLAEYYSAQIGDPFVALTPPSSPAPAGTPTGTCSTTPPSTDPAPNPTYNWYCSPGRFSQDPVSQYGILTSVKFEPGNYWFDSGIAFPNNMTSFFSPGIYVYGTKSDAGVTVFSTKDNVHDQITGTNVLFYSPSGDLNFGNNESISFSAPTSGYDGIAVWDAGAGATVTLSNNGTVDSYGGIYVPLGQVVTNNNGQLSTSFIVASSANFYNGTVVNITAP